MEEIYKTYWALDVYAMYNQYYFRELENEIIKKVDRGYTQGIHNEFIYNYDEEKIFYGFLDIIVLAIYGCMMTWENLRECSLNVV